MKQNIRIKIDGIETEVSAEQGISLKELASDHTENARNIFLAIVDGKLRELNYCLMKDADVTFVTADTQIGNDTYRRSVSFLMIRSLYKVVPPELLKRVVIQFSVSKGYYCTIEGEVTVTGELLESVKRQMLWYVERRAPFIKKSVPSDEAMEIFRNQNMQEKEELLKYRRVSRTNIYFLDGFADYFYGYMVPDAGYLTEFELYPYEQGFVLQMPAKSDPWHTPDFEPQNKVFHVLNDSTEWGKVQGITDVRQLNERITSGKMQELVLVQEAIQEKQIADLAGKIASREKVKFILIAGPSSSGKTTFSHRLSIQLKALGLQPHPISVDNFFVERDETPVGADGSYDFECLEAIDVPLFNEKMNALISGEEVVLPTFDFVSGSKKYQNPPMKMGEKDILVIEGIHCLNPKLTEYLDEDRKFRIYISALTQLNIDEHNRIPTTDGRLFRRILRDARTRGSSAERTILMWPSVRKGEEQNIFPYQEKADAMFNSATVYELSVLKPYVEALLFGIPKTSEAYLEAKRLLKFLDYFLTIDTQNIPANSLVREFVGGGCFNI